MPVSYTHLDVYKRQHQIAVWCERCHAEAFHARAQQFAQQMQGVVQAVVPFAPDSNLVCLALNPAGNRSVATANAFVRRLHDELRSDPSRPVQDLSLIHI